MYYKVLTKTQPEFWFQTSFVRCLMGAFVCLFIYHKINEYEITVVITDFYGGEEA